MILKRDVPANSSDKYLTKSSSSSIAVTAACARSNLEYAPLGYFNKMISRPGSTIFNNSIDNIAVAEKVLIAFS